MAEMFTVDRPKESTHARIADALEVIALNTGEDSSEITDWSSLKRIIRGGFIRKALQVGDKVDIDLFIIVEYGISISAVAAAIIETVKYKVEHLTGVPVRHVNVCVEDIRV